MDFQTLARNLLPFLKPLLQTTSGGSVVSGAPSPHGLNSPHHTGTLANSQAPQFLLLDGSRDLAGNLGVNAGVTIDGVDLSAHAADPSAHHSPVTLATPSGLSLAGQQLSLADSVAGDGLTISGKVLAVGVGDGLSIAANFVSLTTPGTLTVSSSNNAASNHTHTITSASNPGAAASLLASDASGYLQLTRLGLGVAPTVPIQARATTEQLRLDYDVSNYAAFTVGSGGNLTVAPTGDFVFDPAGNDVLPNTGYDLNLGSLTKKYLTLHAAELWVETLVAQNTLATIGGRILVGPTTTLIEDVNSLSLAIKVKHNQMSSGDRVYLEANGSVEFMAITSGPSVVAGGYQYSVTRNLDGSGINNWYAGDAVFNTGQAGDGFIDLYSVQGVSAGSSAGPTIVGNVRNSSTYNDWTEHWAIGNLNGLYGYGTDTYGVGLGKFGAGSENYVTFDATNGVRFFEGSTVQAQLSGATWTLGSVSGGEYVKITSSAIELYGNAVKTIDLRSNGDVYLGNSGGARLYYDESANTLDFLNSGGTSMISMDGVNEYLEVGLPRAVRISEYGVYVDTDQGKLMVGPAFATSGAYGEIYGGLGSSGQYHGYYQIPAKTGSDAGYYNQLDILAGGHTGANLSSAVTFRLFSQADGTEYFDWLLATSSLMRLTDAGMLLLGDTVNTGMTTGLTINQGAADDEVLARKSSDVAHGMTAISETDTYGYDSKHSATEGGLKLVGLSEGTVGLSLFGLYTNDDTTRSTAAVGGVQVDSRKKSGTTTGSPGANANLFVVRSNGNARFLVDQEGDIHMDATSNINAWDEWDDMKLLTGLRASLLPEGHILRERFAHWLDYAKPVLEKTGVVTYNDHLDKRPFMSIKGMLMLIIDAMRQMSHRMDMQEKAMLEAGIKFPRLEP